MPGRSREQEVWPGVSGSHACLTYADDGECRALLTGFVRRAVAAGHRVVIFLDAGSAELGRAVAAAASGAVPGQFSALSFDAEHAGPTASTFGGPRHGVGQMLAQLAGIAERAFAAGFPALALAGDMAWTLRAGYTPADVLGYETRANRFFGDERVTGLCLYDRRRFGRELLDYLGAGHPGPLLRFTLGGWGAHLRLVGELDASNAGSLPSILDLVAAADAVVLIDAGDLDFVDAAGAGAIVRFAASRPNRCTVVRCRRPVRQALRLVGADSVRSLVLRDPAAGV